MESCVEKEQAKLPQEISLISLIQSRYSEIKQIINEFKTTSPKLASQKLPIHMRRRAASHNVKRLPSKTRLIVERKSKGKELTSDSKEKKRKQKRKYQNGKKVNLSHAVREAKCDRSLLHLWFVKRFKMINLFNQLVPNYNTTKNLRKLHRMSKKGCIHFYFPYYKSIIVRIDDIDLVSKKLGQFTKSNFDSFFSGPVALGFTSKWVQFFKDSDSQSQIMGPGYLIFDKKNNILIIWCHTLIHSEISNKLFFICGGKVSDDEKIYQLFSLIGSESLHHLKKTLGDCGSFLPDNFQDGNILTIEGDKILNEPIGEKSSQPHRRIEISQDNNENLTSLIIHMVKMNNRELIFLSTPYPKAKDFWYKLVKNRTHLVGGLRDIKLLTSEMRCLNYPSIGYPDLDFPSNPRREIWRQIMGYKTNYFLLRNQMIISKLKYPKFDNCLIENVLKSNADLKDSLVYVELICINRGTPETGDIICIPTEDDMKKYLGRSKVDIKIDEIGYGPVESIKISTIKNVQQSSRQVIGIVEFGYFSLDLGTGKGFGSIRLQSLDDLIKLNSENKLIALIRSSKSNTFRFVQIIIDNFKLF
ncbi:uncharacterized protein LOC128389637 [Panonychus citri]|uniref:uncharacterized protein LOC128389637 n=1 Tax=Panonychus citri TaxID=50023 RepID=UPI0023075D77|nr:uncharacterized protein LOC128389637 [Panonychus citri]